MTENLRQLTLLLDDLAAQLRVSEPDVGHLEKELQLAKAHIERAAIRERRLTAASTLFDGLAEGGDPATVAIAAVRAMISVKQNLEARSFAGRLASFPEFRETGLICSAIVAVKAKLPVLAGSYLDLVTPETALRHAAPEWYDVAFKRDPSAALLHFQEHPDTRAETALAVIRLCLTHGRTAEAVTMLRRLLGATGDGAAAPSSDAEYMGSYFDRREQAAALSTSLRAGVPRIAIWDFSAPDRNLPQSSIAGHLDSLSWLGALVSVDNVEVAAADPAINGVIRLLASALRGKMPPAVPAGTSRAPARVYVVALPRYAPMEGETPDPIWTLHHGLFGTRVFGTRQKLSLTTQINPLFVGLSVDNPAELSTEELEVLRRFGPVGCRDQASVFMLLSLGVDAFYSGPLISGIGSWIERSLLKELPITESADSFVSPSDGAVGTAVVRQTSNTLRLADLATNLRTALSYLSAIARSERIETDGVETAAAAASLGVEAEYIGAGPQVADHVPGALSNQVGRIPALLEATFRGIAAGESAEEIYAAWRSNTADLVATSREEFQRPVSAPKPLFKVATAIGELQSAKVSLGRAGGDGGTVHIAMASDERLLGQLAVAINSLRTSTSRPLQIHLLTRGIQAEDYTWLAALFPEVRFEFFPCDDVDYGESLSRSSHITVSTMDRLLLPSLLTDVDQVVYLDADLLVDSDIAVLSDIVLKQHPIAACTATADWARSGFGHILAVAKRLPPERSAALIQLVAQQTDLAFDAFNAGVLVLNLKQMRTDAFCDTYLGFPSHFGLNDQEVLFCYAGARRRQLQPTWNANPSHSYISQARIIHWAGPSKPWGELRVPYQSTWLQALERLRERAVVEGIPVEHLDAVVSRR